MVTSLVRPFRARSERHFIGRVLRIGCWLAFGLAIAGCCCPRALEPGALAQDTANSYVQSADVVYGLRELQQHTEKAQDLRALFLTVYVATTESIQRHVDQGRFEDPEYISRSIVDFGNYYREALHAYEAGDELQVPAVWRLAHDAARRGGACRHQVLLLGIVAHIRDLAYVVAESHDSRAGAVQKRDYDRILAAIGEALDPGQRQLAARHGTEFRLVDVAGGRLDETLTLRWLRILRQDAWRFGVALAAARTPEEARAMRKALEEHFLCYSGAVLRAPLLMLLSCREA